MLTNGPMGVLVNRQLVVALDCRASMRNIETNTHTLIVTDPIYCDVGKQRQQYEWQLELIALLFWLEHTHRTISTNQVDNQNKFQQHNKTLEHPAKLE